MRSIFLLIALFLLSSCASKRKEVSEQTYAVHTDSLVRVNATESVVELDSICSEEVVEIDSIRTSGNIRFYGVRMLKNTREVRAHEERLHTDSVARSSADLNSERMIETMEPGDGTFGNFWLWIAVCAVLTLSILLRR